MYLTSYALVSGIYDSYALIGIGFLTFVTMALGGVAEQLFSDALPALENKSSKTNIKFIVDIAILFYK